MASPLNLFVQQLSSLGCELNEMYPEDVDIKMAKNTIETMKKLNPKMLAKTFSDYVLPYKDQILNREERFFLNDVDYAKVVDAEDQQSTMAIVGNLKKYWSGMSAHTKDCRWQYCGVLVKLAEKI